MRFFLLFLLVFVSNVGQAGIRESVDSIVDSRTHRFLTALSDRLGFPDTELGKGQAVAALSTSGCNFSVLIVGPVGGDSPAYARILDGWRVSQGLPGEVEWTQEDDCAAALYRYRPGKPGMVSASVTIDLPSLRSALLKVEPKTSFAASDANWSKIDYGFAPDAETSTGIRYWNFTADRPGFRPVVGTITIPPFLPVALVAWFILLPVGVLGSFGLGIVVAKRTSIPLAQRRKLYGRIVMGGAMGTLMVHSLLVIATLPTRALDPLTQLWFGQRFSQFALFILPLGVLVPVLVLPLVTRFEKRLMGPSEEEKVLRSPEMEPTREIDKAYSKKWFRFAIPMFIIGLALQGWYFSMSKEVPYRQLVSILGHLLVFIPFIAQILMKMPRYKVEATTLESLEAYLRVRVHALAAKVGMEPVASRVITETSGGKYSATMSRSGVGVSVHALEQLQPEEIDWLIAHELAHQKLGHLRKLQILSYLPMGIILIPAAALLMNGSFIGNPLVLLGPFLAVMVITVPWGFTIRRMRRAHEFEADRLAVETTGDREAGISALRKTTLNDASPGIHDTDVSTHPDVTARIGAMRAL
ncbi:hypothetical protein EON81_06265 [bacterium]|nr:MAG: hypothetical protein EON81_06265 [bacterium]